MEADYNWAALAIPVFLGATVVEAWIGQRQGKRVYAFGTAIADLGCGSVFQAVELLLKLVMFGAYIWLYENHRLIDFAEGSAVPWLLGIVGVDFLFYWWHRTSHVVNILWAVHGVHHQSEDYNLAVALRQPIFEPITWFAFYGVLALLGVSPVVYLAAYGINRFYQFWIHTEVVDKGPAVVEWLLNTPSHHRVHHGVDETYLDRNYGAVLMIWDRLFGSFQPEEQRPTYGTTIPLRSYSPVWANFEHIARIRMLAAGASTLREKVWAWFAHPAWLPRGVKDPATKPDRSVYKKYRPEVPRPLRRYVLIHFGLAGVGMGVVVFFEHFLSAAQLAVAATILVATFASVSGLTEARPWARRLELARLPAFVAATAWLLSTATSLPWLPLASVPFAICVLTLPLLRTPTRSPAGHDQAQPSRVL